VARFQNYRGFLFGSLSEDVLPLEEYLGETRVIIDQIVDQAPTAWKCCAAIPATSMTATGRCRWKTGRWLPRQLGALELRRHHGPPQGRRHQGHRCQQLEQGVGGVYGFENGHILLWTNTLNPEVRPIWNHREELAARVGQARADTIVAQTRNLCLYPNVFLMDQFGRRSAWPVRSA
jgi:benzoate/toluate 1,2-dioxygenase alpha subunit